MHCLTVFLLCIGCVSILGCGFLGGGGGGCGGGCGCGRKKRSIDSVPLPFTNLAGKDTDALCNSPELRATIQQNLKETAVESGKAISAELERFGDRYVVVCSKEHFDFFVRHDSEFCGARHPNFYCQAFAL